MKKYNPSSFLLEAHANIWFIRPNAFFTTIIAFLSFAILFL